MKNDLKTKILMFLVSMLQRFYLGVPAILFLLFGIFSPKCQVIGLVLLVLWLIISTIGYMTTISILNSDPVVRETLNSVIANDNLGNHLYQDGQEIEFTDIPEENVKLVGRCLNSTKNAWVMRLLYEDTYQIFNWEMQNGPSIEPKLISLSKFENHEKEYLVKGYEKDIDDRVRAQLYWLKRDEVIYKDYRLDIPALIEQLRAVYHIEWDNDNETIHYLRNDENQEVIEDIPIAVANMGGGPVDMLFGNTIYYDLDQMKIFLSVGERYEELGNTEHATHHIVADIELTDDGIRVSNIHFELSEGRG